MAPMKRLYTLVDFAEDLDWKPLHFLKPLPRKRRCSVCTLVRKATTVLPCGHVVCRCCYDGCEVEDEYVCPKDGKDFPGKVKWRHFPTKNMLRRKVKCWNEAHGCTAVMAASKVSEHFNRECQYHSTLCSRCSTMVLCSDMCEHLKSSCRELRVYKARESDKKPGGILQRLRKMLDGTVLEMKALLEQSIIPDGSLHHTMSTVDKSFECLIELVKEGRKPLLKITEFLKMLWSNVEGVNERLVNLRWQCAVGFGEVLLDIESAKQDGRSRDNYVHEEIRNVFNSVSAKLTTLGFVIPDVSSLAAAATVYGRVFYFDTLTYLRGYHIYPGFALRKKGEHVYLFLFLTIEEGELDNLLRWPFNHLIKCRFVHESTGEEYVLIVKPPRNSPSFEKPAVGAKRKFVFPKSVTLERLEAGGYVHNDELRVIWELL